MNIYIRNSSDQNLLVNGDNTTDWYIILTVVKGKQARRGRRKGSLKSEIDKGYGKKREEASNG